MYNPDEKDVDLMTEYDMFRYSISGKSGIDPYIPCRQFLDQIALQHRKSIFQSGTICQCLRYADVDDDQLVDIYYKEGADCKPSPLFVFIPGCEWYGGNKERWVSMVGPLVKNGYRVAVVEYNSCPHKKMTAIMEEFCGFTTWISEYATRTPTTDITFAGHASGAHLLTQLLHMPNCVPDCIRSKIKSMFLLCGVYDFREVQHLAPIGMTLQLIEEDAVDVSSILWSWKDEAQKWGCLQIHVLTVEHTSVTYQEQSRQFSEVLEHAGFNSTFKQFDGLDSFTIILDQNEDKNEITKYIKTAMQKASAGSSKGSNRPCTCASKR